MFISLLFDLERKKINDSSNVHIYQLIDSVQVNDDNGFREDLIKIFLLLLIRKNSNFPILTHHTAMAPFNN